MVKGIIGVGCSEIKREWQGTSERLEEFRESAFTVPTPEGGLDTLRGQGVVVWRRGDDGRWRCAVDIWNPRPE
jgi:ketosteroid isomerase-like protein